MKNRVKIVSLVGFIFATSSCGLLINDETDKLNVKAWVSEKNSIGQIIGPFPERELSSVMNRKNVGIAVSGGGTRSATAFAGQLRAFHKLGLLDDVRYISAVSGGAWSATPFCFYEAGGRRKISDFLGDSVSPKQMTLAELKKTDKERGYPTLAGLSASANITTRALTVNLLDGDERYSGAISSIFLKKIGIENRNKYFTYNEVTLKQALDRNDGTKGSRTHLKRDDFYLSAPRGIKKPFLICNGYLVNLGSNRAKERAFHTEMTPYYVSVKRYNDRNKKNPFGGGLVETYGYDSLIDTNPNNRESNSTGERAVSFYRHPVYLIRPRFSLSDMMATTGNAPSVPVLLSWVSNILGLPEFVNWSPQKKPLRNTEYRHTDGGAVDNLGVMALLSRKVDTMIVFVNSEQDNSFVVCKNGQATIGNSVRSLFEKVSDSNYGLKDAYKENLVFRELRDRNGKTPYERLLDKLKNKYESGQPLVAVDTYETRNNEMHAVPAGHKVKVIWFILGGSNETDKTSGEWIKRTKWFNNLPPDTQTYVLSKTKYKRSLRKFPFYGTFFANPLKVVDLKNIQVNLLSNYTAHSVWINKDLLKDAIQKTSK